MRIDRTNRKTQATTPPMITELPPAPLLCEPETVAQLETVCASTADLSAIAWNIGYEAGSALAEESRKAAQQIDGFFFLVAEARAVLTGEPRFSDRFTDPTLRAHLAVSGDTLARWILLYGEAVT